MKKWMLPIMLAAFAWAGYSALTVYDRYFPYGRMRETPAVRPYEKPLLVMEAGTVPVADAEAGYRAIDGRELRSPLLSGDAQAITRGQTVYATFCRQCHGRDHDGNGTVGQSFTPLPTDIRSSRVQELTDGVLFQHISYGTGKGRQPPLATTLRIGDRWAVIAYIKSIGVRQ
ncbi:MAG: c-type cytochrome [Pseudomonadota bacterium]